MVGLIPVVLVGLGSGYILWPRAPLLAKGALLYEAKLDGTLEDIVGGPPVQAGDKSVTAFRLEPGMLELSVLKVPPPGTFVTATFVGAQTFVAEIDLEFVPGSTSVFNWTLRQKSGSAWRINLNSQTSTMQLGYFESNTPSAGQSKFTPLTAATTILGLQSGRRFTIAAVVEASRITIFLDQKQVGQANVEDVPSFPTAVGLGTNPGTVRVRGVRYYQLP